MIYHVRHGQSLANIEGKYQGQRYDTDLSPQGISQAESVAPYFTDKNIARVISSPAKRAYQTAQIISRGLNISVVVEPQVIETDHGDWSYLSDDEIRARWPKLYRQWQSDPDQTHFPGGEHFGQETVPRIVSWWDNIKYSSDNLIIVSHENVIQIIITYILKQPAHDIWLHRVGNCSVTAFNSENQSLELIGAKIEP